eukprot:s3129_g10.t1
MPAREVFSAVAGSDVAKAVPGLPGLRAELEDLCVKCLEHCEVCSFAECDGIADDALPCAQPAGIDDMGLQPDRRRVVKECGAEQLCFARLLRHARPKVLKAHLAL